MIFFKLTGNSDSTFQIKRDSHVFCLCAQCRAFTLIALKNVFCPGNIAHFLFLTNQSPLHLSGAYFYVTNVRCTCHNLWNAIFLQESIEINLILKQGIGSYFQKTNGFRQYIHENIFPEFSEHNKVPKNTRRLQKVDKLFCNGLIKWFQKWCNRLNDKRLAAMVAVVCTQWSCFERNLEQTQQKSAAYNECNNLCPGSEAAVIWNRQHTKGELLCAIWISTIRILVQICFLFWRPVGIIPCVQNNSDGRVPCFFPFWSLREKGQNGVSSMNKINRLINLKRRRFVDGMPEKRPASQTKPCRHVSSGETSASGFIWLLVTG